jgi:predicted MFS family arabinose efflux permease
VSVECVRCECVQRMSCSQYAAMLGFYAPYVYICKRAELNGASSDDAAILLSLIGARACVRTHTCAGITNTAGRVVYGWLADRQWVSSQTLVNMSMLMVAVANCALAATAAYVCAVVYALVFGFIVGRVSVKCCMHIAAQHRSCHSHQSCSSSRWASGD